MRVTNSKIGFVIVACLIMSGPVAHARSLSFQSSTRQTTLLEVYGSEGCSSCPPADEWVSHLKEAPGLWKEFIPISFHVDYWDQLGWKDSFASPAYTQRQSDYVQSWGESTLYTPGFVVNGKAWNGWHRSRTIPSTNENPGVLKIKTTDSGQFQVVFEPAPSVFSKLEAHLVLLGFDIRSDVKRGENAGRILKHDFVVLDYKAAPMLGEPFTASFQVSEQRFSGIKLGVAAWVTQGNEIRPLQATGGYLGAKQSDK